MSVARLGDGTGPSPLSRGMFARHQSEDAHQLSGVIETGDITKLGQNSHGTEHIKAPQADERLHHRCQRPGCRGGAKLIVKVGHTPGCFLAGINIVLKDHLLYRCVKGLLRQPVRVRLRPSALARRDPTMPEKEGTETLPRFGLNGLHIFPGTGQVPHRLLFRTRYPHRC